MSSLSVLDGSSTTKTPASTGTTGSTSTTAKAGEDRFLTLLVAQMQNQDPLNPMDNAQVTTQMAQISTVEGIDKLNTTVAGLNSQFVQMQALQGASLVGRDVVVKGDYLSTNDEDLAQGAFDLGSAADSVKVEVLNAAGLVIDTVDLGAQGSGRHGFDWVPSKGVDASAGERFRVVAKSGSSAIPATALMRDTVDAVSTSGNELTLQLRRSGSLAYGDIQAFI